MDTLYVLYEAIYNAAHNIGNQLGLACYHLNQNEAILQIQLSQKKYIGVYYNEL